MDLVIITKLEFDDDVIDKIPSHEMEEVQKRKNNLHHNTRIVLCG